MSNSPLVSRSLSPLRALTARQSALYGVAVHCTGSGIAHAALAAGRGTADEVMAVYGNPANYCPAYVVDLDGAILQIADESGHANHVGFDAGDRQTFLSGAWEDRLSADFVARWKARWPVFRSPAHLFPGTSPNDVYLGVELVVWLPGCPGEPPAPGENHTAAQYAALGALCADVAHRKWLPDDWAKPGSPRLVTHEDLNPLERTNSGGGWDPGVLRAGPTFDWGKLLTALAAAQRPAS